MMAPPKIVRRVKVDQLSRAVRRGDQGLQAGAAVSEELLQRPRAGGLALPIRHPRPPVRALVCGAVFDVGRAGARARGVAEGREGAEEDRLAQRSLSRRRGLRLSGTRIGTAFLSHGPSLPTTPLSGREKKPVEAAEKVAPSSG